MPALLFTSPAAKSGKTAVALGLAASLSGAGRSTGYVRLPGESLQSDLAVAAAALGAENAVSGRDLAAAAAALQARQVTIVESDAAAAARAAESLAAKIVLVLRGANGDLPAQVASAKTSFGDHLGAVVVNAVAVPRLRLVAEEVGRVAAAQGVVLAGVIPQSRGLIGVSVRDLAQQLEPVSVLGNPDDDAVVDRLMVGTMGLDNALGYFGRFGHKAAIISVNRPDLMIAALQTDTLCIVAANENPVITGDDPVNPVVVSRAKERDVPILITGRPTLDTVEQIERIFGAAGFTGPGKVQIARSLVEEHLDLDKLASVLG